MKAVGIFLMILWVQSSVSLRVWIDKRYEMYESNFFEDYIGDFGVGFFTRPIGAAVAPIIMFEKIESKLTLTAASPFQTLVIEFELGKEFDEVTSDGTNVKSIFMLEDNKLIYKQGVEKPTTTTYEFTPTGMVSVTKIGNVVLCVPLNTKLFSLCSFKISQFCIQLIPRSL